MVSPCEFAESAVILASVYICSSYTANMAPLHIPYHNTLGKRHTIESLCNPYAKEKIILTRCEYHTIDARANVVPRIVPDSKKGISIWYERICDVST